MRVPLVSVVMPVHNGGKFVEEAVESILTQTLPDFEFIIINDGSTDDTSVLLNRYARADSRVRIYNQAKLGLIASLNKGCSVAVGKYIARMDADDVAFPDRFERQVGFLERHPEIAVLGAAAEVIDANGKRIGEIRHPTDDREIDKALLNSCCFAHPTIMMRKEVFRAVGGYVKTFVDAEDYDLWLRIAERYKLANLPEPVLRYRFHTNQVSVVNIKQQVLSILGAQVAAKFRRSSGHDFTWPSGRVTIDDLRKLGVDNQTIGKRLVEAYLHNAGSLLKLGEETCALQLLQNALRHTRLGYEERHTAANVRLGCAAIYANQSKTVYSKFYLARAYLRNPLLFINYMRERVSRRHKSFNLNKLKSFSKL